MKHIKLSKEISLPLDIVTQTIAILAKRRGGKSYTMRKIVEQLLTCQQQVVMVDPKGDQWGIRSLADGKKPGYPIVILGGEHGDAPLEANSGEIVAKLVVEERVSVLLDLSLFRKREIATFMGIFLENLYRLKAQEKYRTPVMLVIDEADAIAPQKPQKGEERMLGAAEDIVRRGGQRGIGCALITQRSAVLNKNVLTQAQMLIVLRTIAPQDLAAMKSWIDVHGEADQGKTLMASLPSLPVGDAWFWSPGWPTAEGIFQRTHILPIETFDSGATPAPGQKAVVPKNLADVDLVALKERMAATIEKAKADNPVVLKSRITELEKELKNQNPAALPAAMGVSQWLEYGKKLGYDDFFVKKALNEQGLEHTQEMVKIIKIIIKIDELIKSTVADGLPIFSAHETPINIWRPREGEPTPGKVDVYKTDYKKIVSASIPINPGVINTPAEFISGPEKRILDGIAWANSIGIPEPENSLAAFLAGYTNPKSTGYTNPRGALTAKGLIRYPVPGSVALTPEGANLANNPGEVGSESQLHSRILERLTGPQGRILRILIEARGEPMSNEILAEKAGYMNPKSTGYTNPRGELRSFGLIDYPSPGMVIARSILFL